MWLAAAMSAFSVMPKPRAERDFARRHQPIVDLGSNRVSGCEALLCWQHPLRGMVSPAEFTPVAEETGLINQLRDILDETALVILHQLRAIGVATALDDFGTGYSSLSYLQRFPFDKIKIDRCFIKDIAEPGGAPSVKAVVNIAAARHITTTAEGAATELQRDLLRALGCNEMQPGFGLRHCRVGFCPSRVLPIDRAILYR